MSSKLNTKLIAIADLPDDSVNAMAIELFNDFLDDSVELSALESHNDLFALESRNTQEHHPSDDKARQPTIDWAHYISDMSKHGMPQAFCTTTTTPDES